MCQSLISTPASITMPALVGPLDAMRKSKNFLIREVVTRVVACVAGSFFQTLDFFLNMIYALGKLPLATLRAMGVKQLSSQEFSFKAIGFHFTKVGRTIQGMVTASIGGAINPNYIRRCDHECFGKEIINKERIQVQNLPKNLKIDHQALASNFLEKEGNTPDQNLHLDQFFGHVYMINLEKNPERKNGLLNHLNTLGLKSCNVEVFKATYGAHVFSQEERKRMKDNSFNISPFTEKGRVKLDKQHAGQMGCYKSHERVIRDAKEHYDAAMSAYNAAKNRGFVNKEEETQLENTVKEYSNILIFEDDARLGFVSEDRKTYTLDKLKQSFWKAMKELPENWDMFYLLPFRIHPLREQDHSYTQLVREDYALTTSTFAVNAQAYDVILKELDKINQPGVDLRPVDHAYAKLHEKIQCFGPRERALALQTDSPSDISGLDRNEVMWQPLDYFNQGAVING